LSRLREAAKTHDNAEVTLTKPQRLVDHDHVPRSAVAVRSAVERCVRSRAAVYAPP
jgi:hypothetical protein